MRTDTEIFQQAREDIIYEKARRLLRFFSPNFSPIAKPQEEEPKAHKPKLKQKPAPSRKTKYRIGLSVLTYLLVKHGVDSYATSIEVLCEAVSKYFRNKERNKFLFASFKRSIYEARRNDTPPKRSTEADIDKAEKVFLSLIDSIKSELKNH